MAEVPAPIDDSSATFEKGVAGLRELTDFPVDEADPELVIALVCPLGVDVDVTMDALVNGLARVGYSTNQVRLSELLDDVVPNSLPQPGEAGYLEARMTAGDVVRGSFKNGAALAALAISRIWQHRLDVGDESKEDGNPTLLGRHATILRSLKHPDEVKLLKNVYRDRLVIIGVGAPAPMRRSLTLDRLRDEQSDWGTNVAAACEELLRRDAEDPVNPYGQNVRRTFEMSDLYIDAANPISNRQEVDRFVDLLFGDTFQTPGKDEVGMAHAHTASLRSSAAGRQVGAVICNEEGDVIAAGCNEVPKPGGGQYWPGEEPDDRDFHEAVDPNDKRARRLLTEVLDRFKEARWFTDEYAAKGSRALLDLALKADSRPIAESGLPQLGTARVSELIEFGRIMHAEMAALMSCAQRGASVANCTLYTTTFPCHECARHIIGAGIARVVYIAPYPKSLAGEMFDKAIAIDTGLNGSKQVKFDSFQGVAPHMYDRLFVAAKRKNRSTGAINRWSPGSAECRVGKHVPSFYVLDQESEVLEALELILRPGIERDGDGGASE